MRRDRAKMSTSSDETSTRDEDSAPPTPRHETLSDAAATDSSSEGSEVNVPARCEGKSERACVRCKVDVDRSGR